MVRMRVPSCPLLLLWSGAVVAMVQHELPPSSYPLAR